MNTSKNENANEEPKWSQSMRTLDVTLRWDGKHTAESAMKLFAHANHLGVDKEDAI